MKASKLIQELQKAVDANGDLEVDFVCSMLRCTCTSEDEYCYCDYKDYDFCIESVNKKTLPKCGKMTTVGITLRSS